MAREETIQQYIDRSVPPDPQFPRLSRVGSISPVDREVLQWILHQPHPLSSGFVIMRMYRRPTGIKIYSVSDNGQMGLLNFLPIAQVSLTEEIMGPPILLAEIAACEAGEDDKEEIDDPEEPEGEDDPEDGEEVDRPTPAPQAAPPATSNGPAAS
jgi:hypothetical protein